MRSRRESASRSAASAASRCISARRARAAIPRPGRRWRSPASTCRISSPARTCGSGSTRGPTGRSATSMTELPPLVLGVAFVVVGVAAWLLGRRAGRARTVRLPRDYYIGLDHLINDRFDRAAEVFARVALSDGDAAEIQFALGSVFRRRGEVDRAIAVTTRLKERGGPGRRGEG